MRYYNDPARATGRRHYATGEQVMGEITVSDSKLIDEIARLKGEITVIKWMLGVLLAGVLSLVLKAFFV